MVQGWFLRDWASVSLKWKSSQGTMSANVCSYLASSCPPLRLIGHLFCVIINFLFEWHLRWQSRRVKVKHWTHPASSCPLRNWLATCFASLLISYSSGICDDNQQESWSNIEQHWGIFAITGLLPRLAVCCYLTSHKQCKHQDFQRPRSRWIHAKCGLSRGFGNVVCSCNFVICTIKYTQTYALGTGFKLVYICKRCNYKIITMI